MRRVRRTDTHIKIVRAERAGGGYSHKKNALWDRPELGRRKRGDKKLGQGKLPLPGKKRMAAPHVRPMQGTDR